MLTALKWDSAFFNRKIALVRLDPLSDVKMLAEDFEKFHKGRFDCAYLIVNKKFTSLLALCKRQGWNPVEKRVEMIKKIEKKDVQTQLSIVSSIKRSDVSVLYSLARQLSRESRFFKDSRLRSKAGKLYEIWVLRSFVDKFAKKCFIAINRAVPVGLCTLRVREGTLTIDLFVVKKTMRLKGIGTTLLNIAQNWAYENRYRTLKVIASKDNTAALQFYGKCGFKTHTESLVYHIWQ